MVLFFSEAKLTRKYYNQVDIFQHKLAAKRKAKRRTSRTKSKARRKTTKTRRKKSKAKSRSRSKSRSKTKRKSGSKKKPFGGYGINFTGRKETVEQVFGKGKVTPSEMTKKLWKFVKAKKLSTR